MEANPGDAYIVQPTRRYAHSAAYLRDAATRAGFEEVLLNEDAARTEHGEDVKSFILVLRKRA